MSDVRYVDAVTAVTTIVSYKITVLSKLQRCGFLRALEEGRGFRFAVEIISSTLKQDHNSEK